MSTKHLTTANGVPVADNQNSLTAGERGPIVFEDFHLFEKLAHFNRERIPERVVHAKGSGAFGELTVTRDIGRYTKAKLFDTIGKKTPLFIRFSTVGGEAGSADSERDPRGFAIKLYTEQGIWDLVGNNTPVFFLRDPSKFPDFIHTQKRHPKTHCKDATMQWDFWSLHPESLHQVTILFSDRGIPDGYRFMDGFGSHTFSMVNAQNERFFVKYHFKTVQGIRNLSPERALELAGSDPDHAQRDLFEAIERGDHPRWKMFIQVMPEADAAQLRGQSVRRHQSLVAPGIIRVSRWARSCSIATPRTTLPTSSRRRSRRRRSCPGSASRPTACCRAGCSRMPTRIAIGWASTITRFRSTSRTTKCATIIATAACASTATAAAARTIIPTASTRSARSATAPQPAYYTLSGAVNRYNHRGDEDYYSQAGDLYRLMNGEQRQLLVRNIVGAMKSVPELIQKRQVAHFHKADREYGAAVEAGLAAARAGDPRQVPVVK